jgi:hypothetical protein
MWVMGARVKGVRMSICFCLVLVHSPPIWVPRPDTVCIWQHRIPQTPLNMCPADKENTSMNRCYFANSLDRTGRIRSILRWQNMK